jgi:H+/gluconate symporter-like permease
MGKVLATLGGAIATGFLTGLLPSTFTTGFTGYIATGLVAVVAGQLAGKLLKNRAVGTFVTVGGLMLVALPLVAQLFPTMNLPFSLTGGTSGMGLITGSNFYVPQANLPGSMASFYLPAAIPTAPAVVPAAGMSGLGAYRSFRRLGRFR